MSMCLFKNNYVYEAQKQKWTVCEPFTILKLKIKSHGIVLICFFVTGYVYVHCLFYLLSGEEERSFQSVAELHTLRLYVTKKKKKKRTFLFGNRLQF